MEDYKEVALKKLGKLDYKLAPDNKTYTVSVIDTNGCEVGSVECKSIEAGIDKLYKQLIRD